MITATIPDAWRHPAEIRVQRSMRGWSVKARDVGTKTDLTIGVTHSRSVANRWYREYTRLALPIAAYNTAAYTEWWTAAVLPWARSGSTVEEQVPSRFRPEGTFLDVTIRVRRTKVDVLAHDQLHDEYTAEIPCGTHTVYCWSRETAVETLRRSYPGAKIRN